MPNEPIRYRPRAVLDVQCLGCNKWFQATRLDAKACSPCCRKRIQRGVLIPLSRYRKTGK